LRQPIGQIRPTTVVRVDETRYRCDGCGNLTRFDVTTSQTTKAFHHFTVGGELQVEEETVISRTVDDVVCRWCGHGRSVVAIADADLGPATDTDREREEPGAQSKVS
jgi:hypothetical protein